MIGISKYRVQGLRDPLMVNVMRALDVERVPLYDNYPQVTLDRQRRIRDLGAERDGPLAPEQLPADDPVLAVPRRVLPHLRRRCPYIHKENGDVGYRAVYKDYMKSRKQAGWRSAKGDIDGAAK